MSAPRSRSSPRSLLLRQPDWTVVLHMPRRARRRVAIRETGTGSRRLTRLGPVGASGTKALAVHHAPAPIAAQHAPERPQPEDERQRAIAERLDHAREEQ